MNDTEKRIQELRHLIKENEDSRRDAHDISEARCLERMRLAFHCFDMKKELRELTGEKEPVYTPPRNPRVRRRMKRLKKLRQRGWRR